MSSLPRFPTLDSMDTSLPSGDKEGFGGSGQEQEQQQPALAPVPPLALPGAAFLRRKRQLSSRRAVAKPLREGEALASARSVDMASSRSLELLMPVQCKARTGGSFHDDHHEQAECSDGDGYAGLSGPPTQRSGDDAAAFEDAAAAHIECMTLNDS
jgi:hypothetical protein